MNHRLARSLAPAALVVAAALALTSCTTDRTRREHLLRSIAAYDRGLAH